MRSGNTASFHTHAIAFADAERRALGPVELRRKAAAFALEAVASQKEQFRRSVAWIAHEMHCRGCVQEIKTMSA
jgi:hypothetical protein